MSCPQGTSVLPQLLVSTAIPKGFETEVLQSGMHVQNSEQTHWVASGNRLRGECAAVSQALCCAVQDSYCHVPACQRGRVPSHSTLHHHPCHPHFCPLLKQTNRVRTILALGYCILGNICRYWVVLLLGDIFFIVTPNMIPIRQHSALST